VRACHKASPLLLGPADSRDPTRRTSHRASLPPRRYSWIVVFGAIAAVFAAFGIGANDVANAYATSVGSKALTIKQACFLAVIFEFAGAVLAGSSVAETIRSGIADATCFQESYMDAALLMYGNLCVVGAMGFWLLLATFLEMPVSTTHTVCGGLVGMAIVTKGDGCVVWYKESGADKLFIPGGITGIVLSWVISPVLSGIVAVILFLLVRTLVLRSSNSFNRAINFYPCLIWAAVWINAFFIVSKGISKKICPKTYTIWICKGTGGKVDGWIAMAFSCGLGLAAALICIPLYQRIRRAVTFEFSEEGITKKEAGVKAKKAATEARAAAADEATGMNRACLQAKNCCLLSVNHDVHEIHAGTAASQTVTDIHAHAEKFDPKAEAVFRYIQIFTAICDSFAHGANDVANAMGPFMAIYAAYTSGEIVSKPDLGNDAYWMLALGGIGIGLGLLLYGYKIMEAIGVKLAVITPSRGFAIELGAAIVIIIGSYIGLPLSTTHCQVGATTGVALLEGSKGVNKFVLGKAALGWILTLIVAGVGAGIIVAQGVHAPLAGSFDAPNSPQAIFLERTCPQYLVLQDPVTFDVVDDRVVCL
jgi:sodium-dependent phosphate transporter